MSQCTDSTNQELEIVKGDDRTLNLTITTGNDELPINLTGYEIYLTAKDNYSDSDEDAKINIQGTITDPTNGIAQIEIGKDITKDLDIANYYYDIKLINTDAEILTIIRGVLNIVWSARHAI